MGLGPIGDPKVIFKRKNRWTFAIEGSSNSATPLKIPDSYVKLSSKPKMSSEPIEVPFKNATLKIPGKYKFENITVTYYDVATFDAWYLNSWINLMNNQITELTRGIRAGDKWSQAEMNQWYSEGTLTMLDGCGQPLEAWYLHYLFPVSVDWGEVSYEDGGISEITLELAFSEISYEPLNSCVPNIKEFTCIGCT